MHQQAPVTSVQSCGSLLVVTNLVYTRHGKCGRYCTMKLTRTHLSPTLRCGCSSPPLPIAIQCLSLTEANMINDCFQNILQQLPRYPHTRELLTSLSKSDVVVNLLSDSTSTFHVVVVGQ
ncbi:hypothetical protein EDD16DRAFT_884278 [Pisolithus croceorrhizus]|nr:hypothetical protein EDD16DRAFT_884278 [Pisolithus croceorrhizus]